MGEPRHTVMIPWLEPDDSFPPVHIALREPNGLLAAGPDLSRERLLDAYRRGIFPWFNEGDPVLWWSPDPRMVLFLDELHVSRSLRRVLRSGRFRVTFDRAFADVMQGCAEPRDGDAGTWITTAMIEAYGELHAQGYAHSVEVWDADALVGGLYGVAIGRMFFGESMFSRRPDASKVALAHVVRLLAPWGFALIDCQMATAHLASLGAREISRGAFVTLVDALVRQPGAPPCWTDASPAQETGGEAGRRSL
jgi:leucyl/phenylalanyl-tRNA--protein transferase